MSELTSWLDKAILTDESSNFTFRRRLELNNGVTLSIQASGGHYCEPRVNTCELCDSGDYTSFEIGFPSHPVGLISQWAEDPTDLTGTVYPRIPVNVIEKLVKKSGGIKGFVESDK